MFEDFDNIISSFFEAIDTITEQIHGNTENTEA